MCFSCNNGYHFWRLFYFLGGFAEGQTEFRATEKIYNRWWTMVGCNNYDDGRIWRCIPTGNNSYRGQTISLIVFRQTRENYWVQCVRSLEHLESHFQYQLWLHTSIFFTIWIEMIARLVWVITSESYRLYDTVRQTVSLVWWQFKCTAEIFWR